MVTTLSYFLSRFCFVRWEPHPPVNNQLDFSAFQSMDRMHAHAQMDPHPRNNKRKQNVLWKIDRVSKMAWAKHIKPFFTHGMVCSSFSNGIVPCSIVPLIAWLICLLSFIFHFHTEKWKAHMEGRGIGLTLVAIGCDACACVRHVCVSFKRRAMSVRVHPNPSLNPQLAIPLFRAMQLQCPTKRRASTPFDGNVKRKGETPMRTIFCCSHWFFFFFWTGICRPHLLVRPLMSMVSYLHEWRDIGE